MHDILGESDNSLALAVIREPTDRFLSIFKYWMYGSDMYHRGNCREVLRQDVGLCQLESKHATDISKNASDNGVDVDVDMDMCSVGKQGCTEVPKQVKESIPEPGEGELERKRVRGGLLQNFMQKWRWRGSGECSHGGVRAADDVGDSGGIDGCDFAGDCGDCGDCGERAYLPESWPWYMWEAHFLPQRHWLNHEKGDGDRRGQVVLVRFSADPSLFAARVHAALASLGVSLPSEVQQIRVRNASRSPEGDAEIETEAEADADVGGGGVASHNDRARAGARDTDMDMVRTEEDGKEVRRWLHREGSVFAADYELWDQAGVQQITGIGPWRDVF